MNDLVLSPSTKKLLQKIQPNFFPENTYLAGGTAIALQLGHRRSNDLDFFTSTEFNEIQWEQKLQKSIGLQTVNRDWQTIIGVAQDVKFSLFYYNKPLIQKTEEFYSVPIASILDMGAIKLDVVTSRGAKRDFVDLYFIAREYGLEKMTEWYGEKFKNLNERKLMIKKALIYFEEAKDNEMPDMIIPCRWEDVKEYFLQEVPKLK